MPEMIVCERQQEVFTLEEPHLLRFRINVHTEGWVFSLESVDGAREVWRLLTFGSD